MAKYQKPREGKDCDCNCWRESHCAAAKFQEGKVFQPFSLVPSQSSLLAFLFGSVQNTCFASNWWFKMSVEMMVWVFVSHRRRFQEKRCNHQIWKKKKFWNIEMSLNIWRLSHKVHVSFFRDSTRVFNHPAFWVVKIKWQIIRKKEAIFPTPQKSYATIFFGVHRTLLWSN